MIIQTQSVRAAYLDLMKRCLCDLIYGGGEGLEEGTLRQLPYIAHTCIGIPRLDNLQACVERALNEGVPGDVIETGVWRGGACILMRAILAAYGDTDRTVWVADSFEGFPVPTHPLDRPVTDARFAGGIKVSLEEVRENFKRYNLLDDQVRFLKGWFSETLPGAPIERLAVLRIDGDMYGSTMDALSALYPRLSAGGYVIVDDYLDTGWPCKAAVDDYRREHGITEEIVPVDWTAIYWRKEHS